MPPTIRSQVLRCTGLVKDPNPHADAPPGAMDVADNVVFRRPGCAELRPGFGPLSSDRVEFSGFTNPDGVIAFGNDLLVQEIAGTSPLKTFINSLSFVDEFGNAAHCPVNAVNGVPSGNALYFTARDSIRKLYLDPNEEYETRTVQVGCPMPHLEVTGAAASGSTGTVQPESYVAYRAILQIVYEDERTVTSPISARAVIYNADATDTVSPSVVMYLPPGLDVVAPTTKILASVYRSKNSSVSPPDELFLAYAKVELTSTHITAGFISFTSADTYADANLGEALYTNPSRGGFARNNARAPQAQDVQFYAGSMFGARLTYPYRKQLRWLLAGGTTSQTGSVTGIGSRTDGSVGTTINSPTLTGVTTTGLQVGMMVVVDGHTTANPGTPLLIAALPGGGVVTLSENLTSASDPSATAVFYDAVHVKFEAESGHAAETQIFPVMSARYLMRGLYQTVAGTMDTLPAGPYSTQSERLRGFVIGDIERYTEQTADAHIVNAYLEAFDASHQKFLVSATHGDEFMPPLALPTVDDDDWTESERAFAEDSVTWSKNEESEHFLEAIGTRRIGTPNIPVLRIFSTLDGLWILKARGDGVYRLTGFGERSGFRVEQVSKTCALLHPKLACSDGTAVYAWTNEGAVRISAAGVQNLSAGVVGVDWRRTEMALQYTRTSVGAFAVANRKSNEILFGMPEPDPETSCKEIMVWNTLNAAWSTWYPDSNEWGSACVSDYLVDAGGDYYGLIHLIPGGEGSLAYQERGVYLIDADDAAAIQHADDYYSITVTDVTGAVITIAGGSGWTPAVGDLVVDNPEGRYMVTAITSATVFTVDRAGMDGGSATAFVAFTGHVRWTADFGGGPGLAKRFEATTLHCESTIATTKLSITAFTPPKGTVQTQEFLLTGYGSYLERLDDSAHEYPEDVRCQLRPDAATGNRLLVGMTIRQADSRIRITGQTIDYTDVGKAGTSP